MINSHAISILTLGFLLGLKHALDADHLIAVSTMLSERKGFWYSSWVGIWWGIGHTAALLVVAVIMIALDFQIPSTIALVLEFVVALLLIFLGIRILWKIYHGAIFHIHVHKHENHVHVHPHIHEYNADHQYFQQGIHHHASSLKKKPLIIGMIHGIAGSAALMLMVLTTISSQLVAIVYVAVFGLGSIGGMLIMSTLIGVPLSFTSRNQQLNKVIQTTAGIVSVGFGSYLTWQIGFEQGLFS